MAKKYKYMSHADRLSIQRRINGHLIQAKLQHQHGRLDKSREQMDCVDDLLSVLEASQPRLVQRG